MEQSKKSQAMIDKVVMEANKVFTEAIKKSGGNEFTEYQITAHHNMIYPEKNAIAYLTLGVMSGYGELAEIQRRVVRGDYVGKGVHRNEEVTENVVNSCAKMMCYLAALVTLTGEALGNVLDSETFLDYEDIMAFGKEDTKLTTGTLTLIMGCTIGDFIHDIDAELTKQDKDLIKEFANELTSHICSMAILLERPLSDVFSLKRIKLDTGES